MDDILTTKQAAAYIKKPIPWIREHVQELGGARLGRDYRFEREEILKYLRQNRVGRECLPSLNEVTFVRALR